MYCNPSKNEVKASFNRLAKALNILGIIENPQQYSNYFPAFISFAFHIRAYCLALPVCRNKRVLDIGCFTAYGSNILSLATSDIYACDNDIRTLQLGRSVTSIKGIKVLGADAGRMPFPDESFTVICAFQLLEHLPPGSEDVFLGETNRILKKGGILLLTTPNRNFRLLPFQRPFNQDHYREYSLKCLSKTLVKVYPDCRITGLRARDWIESLEKKRVRQSSCRVYFLCPLTGILKKLLPEQVRLRIKKNRDIRGSRNQIDPGLGSKGRFDDCFQRFSLKDIYQTEEDLGKAVEFFVTCRKSF